MTYLLSNLKKALILTFIASMVVSCGTQEQNLSEASSLSGNNGSYFAEYSGDAAIESLILTFEPESLRHPRKKVPGTQSDVSVNTRRNCVDLHIGKHVRGDGERSGDYHDITFFCMDKFKGPVTAFDKEWPAQSIKVKESNSGLTYEISRHEAIFVSTGGFCNILPFSECPREFSHVRKLRAIISVDSQRNLLGFDVLTEKIYQDRSGNLKVEPSERLKCFMAEVVNGMCQ